MSPLLSSKGRTVGKLVTGYKTTTIGQGLGSSETETETYNNYFGSGDDGALETSGNVTYTVPNKNGSYDGDMVVKHYSSILINTGHTLTTDQPCRGLMLFCKGDCVINGTITMHGRGPLANPSSNGGSDNNAVSANGLQIPFAVLGGTDTLTAHATNLNGCGNDAKLISDNFTSIGGSTGTPGTILEISRNGAGDTAAPSNSNSGANGAKFAKGSENVTSTGGGGQGANGYGDGDGIGRSGTCFGGGSGGGGGNNNGINAETNATAYGGAGGLGVSKHTARCTGGAGNPNGTESTTGGYHNAVNVSNGETGTGGVIWLIVGGNVTLSSGGTINVSGSRSDGIDGNGYNWCSTGGGSGGGALRIAYKGTWNNTGTINALGGVAGEPVDDGNSQYSGEGGNGGDASVTVLKVA